MSRYWPTALFAEDQAYARPILTTHVWARGWTTGAVLAAVFTTAKQILPRTRAPDFAARLTRNAARGGLVGGPLLLLALQGRMSGREEVEWQDRSWRLLANRGQVETDDWTVAGMAAGPLVWAAAGLGKGLAGRSYLMGVLGASSLGGIGGTVAYLVWRHGIKGGKFPDEGKRVLQRSL